QMLTTPSALSTATATNTGQLAAIESGPGSDGICRNNVSRIRRGRDGFALVGHDQPDGISPQDAAGAFGLGDGPDASVAAGEGASDDLRLRRQRALADFDDDGLFRLAIAPGVQHAAADHEGRDEQD